MSLTESIPISVFQMEKEWKIKVIYILHLKEN